LKNYKLIQVFIMLLCIAITAFTLSKYAFLIQHLPRIKYSWQFELAMVIGMLFFQFPFIYKKSFNLKFAYYYNMLLVSLIGSILLCSLLIINHFYACTDLLNLLYFFGVVIIMFFNHKKRVNKLALPAYLSYSWILYRFIILIFIL
jgi:hypothetical protein